MLKKQFLVKCFVVFVILGILAQPAFGFSLKVKEAFALRKKTSLVNFNHQLTHHFRPWLAKNIQIVHKIKAHRNNYQKTINYRFPFDLSGFNNYPHFLFNFSPFYFHRRKVASGILGKKVKGKKYAIVIGISDYPGTENDLNYADDDARLVASVLENQYGFNSSRIYLLINQNATAQAIYNLVEKLKSQLTADDELIFYFSGHGAKGIAQDGDREIIDESIVVNDENGVDLRYLWDGQLKQWFSDFPTSRITFIFDSCLAGGMSDLAANNRIIDMATQESGFWSSAAEGKQWGGGHGEFTYYFFEEGIKKDQADVTPNDGIISDEEAFDYAKLSCQSDRPTIIDQFDNDLVW